MFMQCQKPIIKILCYRRPWKCVRPATGLACGDQHMWLIDTNTGIFLITVITIGGFFLGHAMDGVLGDEGFGAYGNMFVILVGFVGGIFLMRYLGYSIKDFRIGVTGGLVGAFVVLVTFVLTKNVMHRLGY